MELKDTIKLMESEDYKERFKAEYYQTKIRYDKLHKMIIKYEAGTLNFTSTCSKELLKEQAMYIGAKQLASKRLIDMILWELCKKEVEKSLTKRKDKKKNEKKKIY